MVTWRARDSVGAESRGNAKVALQRPSHRVKEIRPSSSCWFVENRQYNSESVSGQFDQIDSTAFRN